MSWLLKLWNLLSGKGTPSKPVPETPVKPSVPSEPVKPSPSTPSLPEAPKAPEKPVVTLPKETLAQKYHRWSKLATSISMRFEGDVPWANPTGNFDDMGLTMGALGWTFGYGDQQQLVKTFVEKYGVDSLYKLMPSCGKEYWRLCNLPTKTGTAEIAKWSVRPGSSDVAQPYKAELVRFWQDSRMVDIQADRAHKDMASFAIEQGERFCKAAGLSELNFTIFAFFFDWRVLNGPTMKDVTYGTAYAAHNGNWDLCVQDVLQYCENVPASIYSSKSARMCGNYWKSKTLKAPVADWQKALLTMGYQRAKKSNPKSVADVLSRRGTLALGEGYVHEVLYNLKKDYYGQA